MPPHSADTSVEPASRSGAGGVLSVRYNVHTGRVHVHGVGSTEWSFSLDTLLIVGGFAFTFAVYWLQRRDSRKRDIEAARALLAASRDGMATWADDYFADSYTDATAHDRAHKDYEWVMSRNFGHIYAVPIEPFAALIGNPASGRWVREDTMVAVGTALQKIVLFNELVRQKTDWTGRHIAEILDEQLSDFRREQLARAAEGQSFMLHAGIGNTWWYRTLKDAIARNIEWLDDQLKPPWKRRRHLNPQKQQPPAVEGPQAEGPVRGG